MWYQDADGDGLGDLENFIQQCERPEGYVGTKGDVCPANFSSKNNGCPTWSVTENYVNTNQYTAPYKENNLSSVKDEDAQQSITYYDGLGRPKQQIAIGANPEGHDIVTPILYDAFGRQDKEYLPYVSDPTSEGQGSFRVGDQAAAVSAYYYQHFPDAFTDEVTANPYSEKHFEASPLGRVFEQGAPGTDWSLDKESDNDHSIKLDYDTNVSEEVLLYRVSLDTAYVPSLELSTLNSGYYAAGTLYKTVTKDENWTAGNHHTTEEFKDKQGRVVLKRTYDDSVPHDTYYVYDDFGNLTYVLPPKAAITASSFDTGSVVEYLSELCYQYQYDHRNRLVQKKIPGKAWEYIVYDKLDRPVLTQDALLREHDQWLFTKYDVFGRVAYTGIYTHSYSIDQAGMQSELDNFYTDNNKPLYETKVAQGSDFQESYYGNESFPQNELTLHTINYYDDYEFDLNGLTIPAEVFDKEITDRTKTLATGTKVKVLDTDTWTTSVTAYDGKGRAVWVGSYNAYLQTTDVLKTELDFSGKVLQTIATHTKEAQAPIVVRDRFTYDHAGRLLTQVQAIAASEEALPTLGAVSDLVLTASAIETKAYTATKSIVLTPGFTALPGFHAKIQGGVADNGEEELIFYNKYDALGQLEQKKVGGTVGDSFEETPGLQTIDYSYNIRGWLLGINDDTSDDNDLFDFALSYNNPTTGATPLYNGNISQTHWQTKSEDPSRKSYTYSYDALNRITSALDNTGHYNLNAVTYDKNGNILSLQRKGHVVEEPDATQSDTFGVMDDLIYTYDSGNKLQKVVDNGNDAYGFKDGVNTTVEYIYDANGNMTQDLNKGITLITYNHLNLPTEVQFGTVNKIQYIYDAAGTKLQKKVIENSLPAVTTQYAGNYVYKGVADATPYLEFFNHPEGYVEPDEIEEGYSYVYQYKDHLGNVRLSYTENEGDIEIVEENNYYPFGLRHKGYNNVVTSTSLGQKEKTFQGQRLDDELGLNWHDFGARNYDASLGRWMSIDPLAENYFDMTPYNYVASNPVYYIDPDGMIIKDPDKVAEKYKTHLETLKKTIAQFIKSGNLKEEVGNKLTAFANSELGKIKKLEKSDQVYTFSSKVTSKEGGVQYDSSTEEVKITVGKGDVGLIGHELNHAYQFEKGEISIASDNSFYGSLYDVGDETSSYNVERQVNSGVVPYKVWKNADVLNFGKTKMSPPAYQTLPTISINLRSKQGKQLRKQTIEAGKNGTPVKEVYIGWQKDYAKGAKQAKKNK